LRGSPSAKQSSEEADVDCILPIQQSEFGIPISLEQQPDLVDIPAFYRRDNGNFWVALSGDEVVGTIALLDIGNRQGALRKMFVTAAWRGAAHGVGGRLLDTLLRWCSEHDERNLSRHHGEIPGCAPVLREERFCRNRASGPAARASGDGGGTKFYKALLAASRP
jgi:hypothetical protein